LDRGFKVSASITFPIITVCCAKIKELKNKKRITKYFISLPFKKNRS
jgi:hypothetical protein